MLLALCLLSGVADYEKEKAHEILSCFDALALLMSLAL